jgi:hypothetical protein
MQVGLAVENASAGYSMSPAGPRSLMEHGFGTLQGLAGLP